ncbi:TPA: MobA/MobL family protein [Klebsiella variicola]|uniref:MobQ family relaxase n=1 Tax=Klebsiella variicola TaxID=244366 RepID=UPI00125BA76D|nr:MobQ family relaxase [Klebsiella variicola]VAN83964.1 DNA strand transferase [Klebsiella variicola]HBS5821048.1 MobA/MobL family protein [Klebsiella variicola]
MAIFHLSFSILKRSAGKSSCYLAAYNARERIEDVRTGDVYDYSYRSDLFHHCILAPQHTPFNIVENSAVLWNEIEKIEKRKDAQLSRYFDIAIPVELDNDAKIALVKNYCKRNFVSKGMIADISFHDLDGHNPHAHVMLTLRDITPQGFGNKNRSWNEHDLMDEWRASWSRMSNRALERTGSANRMDHRSLAAQREEAIALAKAAQEAGRQDIANEHLAKAIEFNRPALNRINRKSWHTKRAKALRAAEQTQAAHAKQAADDFRQLFNSNVGHLITVSVDSFRIETVKAKPAPQQPAKRSPELLRSPVLVVPEKKRRFKPAEVKPNDMSLYYGVQPVTVKSTLLRRKRRINLHKLYDFIKTFMSVLVKRPVEAVVPNPAIADPLDEIMVDPVTKLKITRRQWESMGTTSKSADVTVSPDANYNQEPEKKQEPNKTSRVIAFPPLPKEKEVATKSKGFTLPKLRFGPSKRKDE